MEKVNITRSILSISAPGTSLLPNDALAAARLTRQCNEYTAELKRKYPTRFGFFASLPLPFVPESVAEIGIALDEGADGFVVLTNHHGVYLGDPKFDPVFEELERRKAKVFMHPNTPCMTCVSHYPPTEPGNIKAETEGNVVKATPLMDSYRSPMFEFFFDTARAVINLILSETVKRCPSVTFIIPHAGGCLPPVFSRFTAYAQLVPSGFAKVTEEGVRETLHKQFFFDMAGWVFPGQLWGLTKGLGIGADRLLYGTDYCFSIAEGVEMFARVNDEGMKDMFSEEETELAYQGNAIKLLGLKEDDMEQWAGHAV